MTLTMNDVSSGGPEGLSGKGRKESGPRDGQTTRRTFTAAYKVRIVGEYDALTEHGARGALLRREGLYESHIGKWRRARDQGALGAARTSGPATAVPAENRRLKAENARLTAELAKTRPVLEVMGKVHAL
ncbi:transposase, partial [Frankia sp. Cas8]|uniref:transposase n=1 Tax=unclassified Frankia TaxID=2632575 RepID=UPI003A0FE7B5